MSEIGFSIAGVAVRLTTDGAAPNGLVTDKLRPFAVDPLGELMCDVDLRWEPGDPDTVPRGKLLFDPGSIWQMHADPTGGGVVASVAYPSSARRDHGAAIVPDAAWRHIRMVERVGGSPWHSLLNLGAGELIVRTHLIPHGGIVCHACGVDDGGRGIMMVGHSGAGKSTQALIWAQQPGVSVLSDDRVAVRMIDGRPWAYGTPWGGTADIAKNARVPLNAILVLQQAPENAIIRMEPSAAAPMLLARSFLPYWSPGWVGTAIDTISSVLSSTPVFLFRCRKDESVLAVVRSIL